MSTNALEELSDDGVLRHWRLCRPTHGKTLLPRAARVKESIYKSPSSSMPTGQ